MKTIKAFFLILAVCALTLTSGCTPAGTVSVTNAGYNPSTGVIGGDISVDFEFREIILDGKLVRQQRPLRSKGPWVQVPLEKK